MYLRVRDIFSMAADYSPSLPETTQFFRFIQNKLHFAVTGKTAAELIAERADSSLPNMGLMTWESGDLRIRYWSEKRILGADGRYIALFR